MNTKSFFIAAIIFFASCMSLRAQEVYEHGMVVYYVVTGGYSIKTSLNGIFTEREGKLTDRSSYNLTPVNEVLDKLSAEGWELHNMAIGAGNNFYYFSVRRKKA